MPALRGKAFSREVHFSRHGYKVQEEVRRGPASVVVRRVPKYAVHQSACKGGNPDDIKTHVQVGRSVRPRRPSGARARQSGSHQAHPGLQELGDAGGQHAEPALQRAQADQQGQRQESARRVDVLHRRLARPRGRPVGDRGHAVRPQPVPQQGVRHRPRRSADQVEVRAESTAASLTPTARSSCSRPTPTWSRSTPRPAKRYGRSRTAIPRRAKRTPTPRTSSRTR